MAPSLVTPVFIVEPDMVNVVVAPLMNVPGPLTVAFVRLAVAKSSVKSGVRFTVVPLKGVLVVLVQEVGDVVELWAGGGDGGGAEGAPVGEGAELRLAHRVDGRVAQPRRAVERHRRAGQRDGR